MKDLSNLKKHLTKVQEQPLPRHVGILLRDRRLALELTLDEVAHPICSSSTLSKIETHGIETNHDILEALYQKLQLTPKDLNDISWLHTLRQCIYQGQSLSESLISPHSLLNYQYRLATFTNSILNHRLEDAHQQHRHLKKLYSLMSNEELQFYIMMLGKYHLLISEGDLSIQYYHLSQQLAHTLQITDPLLMYFLAKYYSQKEETAKSIEYTTLALNQFLELLSIKYITACKLLLIKNYITEDMTQKALPLLKQLQTQLQLKDEYHQRALLWTAYGDYYVAISDKDNAEKMYLKALNEQKIFPENWIACLDFYYYSNQMKKLKKALDILKDNPLILNQQLNLRIKFYTYLVTPNQEELLRIFLIQEGVPLSKKQHDHQGFKLFIKTLLLIYSNQHKYKDALKILYKFC